MIGQLAGVAGGFGLSHEHACKVIRQKHVSKSGRSANAGPRGCLSPFSGARDCGKVAFVGDLLGGLLGSDDELTLSFDAGRALVLPIADEVARGSTSDADNHGRPAGSHTLGPPRFGRGLVAQVRPRLAARKQARHLLAFPYPLHAAVECGHAGIVATDHGGL